MRGRGFFGAIALSLVLNGLLVAQPSTVQERLGYPRDARLLVIHADDFGMSHSEPGDHQALAAGGSRRPASSSRVPGFPKW
jgi:hypothetical protein